MADVRLNLSIPETAKFHKAMREAREQGLKVENMSEDLGFVSGVITSDALPSLRRIDGVGSVEIDREVAVPRPVSRR